VKQDDIFTKVKEVLEDVPQARESDPYLCFKFYQKINPKFRPPQGNPMTVNDFFEKLHNRDLPAFSSITRAKRKVMEVYVELRGKNYQAKKTKGVETMVNWVKKKGNDEPQIRAARNTLNGHYRTV
jgi:hypothetical protein